MGDFMNEKEIDWKKYHIPVQNDLTKRLFKMNRIEKFRKIFVWFGLIGLVVFVGSFVLWQFDFATLGDTILRLIYYGFISVISFVLSLHFKRGD